MHQQRTSQRLTSQAAHPASAASAAASRRPEPGAPPPAAVVAAAAAAAAGGAAGAAAAVAGARHWPRGSSVPTPRPGQRPGLPFERAFVVGAPCTDNRRAGERWRAAGKWLPHAAGGAGGRGTVPAGGRSCESDGEPSAPPNVCGKEEHAAMATGPPTCSCGARPMLRATKRTMRAPQCASASVRSLCRIGASRVSWGPMVGHVGMRTGCPLLWAAATLLLLLAAVPPASATRLSPPW